MQKKPLSGDRRQDRVALDLDFDRHAGRPLAEQIAASIRAAIVERHIAAGARLPSWQDLSKQLGVARGTIRAAYEKLADEALVVPAGSAGTIVAEAVSPEPVPPAGLAQPLRSLADGFYRRPLPFQMGVPAQDAFPAAVWARQLGRAARLFAAGPTSYTDPRGMPELRAQIASHLAIARGLRCLPDQIVVTGGYRSSLGLLLNALADRARDVWVEDPGYPVTRSAVGFAGHRACLVPVDEEGIDVCQGIERAPDAALAVVTAGQQAPLGYSLSPQRRRALLAWARRTGAWILEDDYLSELQLHGRTPPAVAAEDRHDLVFHAGTFSKTLSPTVGLGFLVSPLGRAEHIAEVAAHLAPAPCPVAQSALALFMQEGHYLRHLRRMKRLYAARRDRLLGRLAAAGHGNGRPAGLAVVLPLPEGCDDVVIARAGLERGLRLVPLSPWFADPATRRPGFILGIANLTEEVVGPAVEALRGLLEAAKAAR